MKKLIALSVSLFVLLLAGSFLAGCNHPPAPPTRPPVVKPKSSGCAITAQALGNNLVAAMLWTNSATGHHAEGMTISIPESGGTLTVIAHPDIACVTNKPNIAAVSMVCTNGQFPNAIPLALPMRCGGFTSVITFDCIQCTFNASTPDGSNYYCDILRPRK